MTESVETPWERAARLSRMIQQLQKQLDQVSAEIAQFEAHRELCFDDECDCGAGDGE